MKIIRVDNYIINKPVQEIIDDLKLHHPSKKLRDVRVTGREIIVTCVNSDHANGCENNPDAHINLDDTLKVPYGWYHCFACGLSCSFVGFIAHYFDFSNELAKQWLIKNYGEKAEEALIFDDDIVLNKEKTVKARVLDESILEQYQHWCPYLAKRKLTREMCENFKVRYDPYHRQVIFPIYDINDKLKMLARRSIDTKFFHMDANTDKEVYGLNIVQKNNIKSCIITEGPFNCLTGWCYGVPTIATLGEISDYQIEQINKSCLNVIYTMFDNDTAGRKFTELIKRKVNKRIIVVELKIPNGFKDLNDLDYNTFFNIYSNR